MSGDAERRKLRVLLVDDSSSVRAVLRRFFSWTEDLEVVGEAEDGAEAVAKVQELSPDVVLMDLVMPHMDGYAATERIMEVRPTPIVVLSSRANRNQMRIAFEAMRRGAVEVLGKPEDTGSWRLLADTLPEMVRTAAAASTQAVLEERRRSSRRSGDRAPTVSTAEPEPHEAPLDALETVPSRLRWVAIGASTGGPAAVRELLDQLGPRPLGTILVVQHITPGFEEGLADWLHRELSFDVRLARDGEAPRPGAVRFAPADAHLLLEADGTLRLDRRSPPRSGHRPSVDALFSSVARSAPESSVGILLTGMGADGAEGLLDLRQAGGLTLAQDEASSVVYGMPRVAQELGAAEALGSPGVLGRRLAALWRHGGRGGR